MSVGILAHLLGKQPFRELAAKVAAFIFHTCSWRCPRRFRTLAI